MAAARKGRSKAALSQLRFGKRNRRSDSALARVIFEVLEPRVLLSTDIVTSLSDSGSGSLRQTIASAASGDTIEFASTLTGDTITLTSGSITISQNLTIDGLGASNLTVSGDNSSTVFSIAANATVSISSLTITGGKASASGGGIINHGTLTINECTITGNTATQNGGGIYSGANSTLAIYDSTISDNSTKFALGGGIDNEGTLSVSGSTISGNEAIFDSGAGISNYKGTLILSNSTISGNSCPGAGGGLYNSGSASAIIYYSTLSGNKASLGDGGGVANNGNLTISYSTLSGNSSPEGGGLFSSSSESVKIYGSTISDNSATYEGGGILALELTLTNSTISGNSAPSSAGIYVLETGTLYGSTISDSSGNLGSLAITYCEVNGNAILSNSGTMDVNGELSVDGAALDNSGTVDMTASGSITLYDSAAINNEANGVFDLNDGSSLSNGDSTGVSFNNDGLLKQTYNGGVGFSNVPLVNESAGTVVVETGTLNLYDGGSNANSSGTAFTVDDGAALNFADGTFTFDGNATASVSGNGQIDLSGGTLTTNGGLSISGLDFSGGTIDGNGSVSLSGTDTWSGGTDNALLVVNSNATLDVTNYGVTLGTRSVSGPNLDNYGTVDMTASGAFTLYDSATINNEANGVFDLNDGGSVNDGDSTAVAFNNDGLMEKTYNAGGGLNLPLINESAGTVVVETGTLQLSNGGSNANSAGTAFTVDNGGTLYFPSGTFTFDGNTAMSVSGSGQVDLSGATLITDGILSVSGLDFSGGTIDGNGSVSLSGTDTWSGGTDNALLMVNSNATLDVTNYGVVLGTSNSSADLDNYGTVDMTESGAFTLYDSSAINNEANGVFNLNDGGSVSYEGSSGAVLNNDGLLKQTYNGGVGFSNVPLVNESAGTVVVETGTLNLYDGGSNANSSGTAFTVDDGAALNFADGTFTFDGNATASVSGNGQIDLSGGTLTTNGGLSISGLDFSGGTIDGNGSVSLSGTDTWSGGTDNALLVVNSNATLDVTNYGVTLGTRSVSGPNLDNYGTVDMTASGAFTLYDSATINNEANGVFDLNDGGSVNDGDSTAVAFNNDGLMEKTYNAGGGLNLPLINESAGTVVVETGTLQLSNGGSNANSAGTAFTVDNGGTLYFPSGTFTFDGNTAMSVSGSGQVDLSGATLITDGILSVSGLDFSGGTIDGNGSVSLSGTDTWSGGTDNALLMVNSNATLDVTNYGVVLGTSNSSADLDNYGTVDMTESGAFTLYDSSAINNEANGVFNLNDGGSVSYEGSSGAVLNNDGLLEKTDDSNSNFYLPLVNESAGTVVVDSGALQLNEGATNANSSGTAFSAAGGNLQFNGGTLTFASSTSMSATNEGSIQFDGGTYAFESNAAFLSTGGGQVELTNGGTLAIEDGLTIAGTLTLDYSTTLQLADTETISGGTINAEQDGSIPWGDEETAYIEIDSGATVTLASGTTLEGGAIIESSGGDPALINEGVIDPLGAPPPGGDGQGNQGFVLGGDIDFTNEGAMEVSDLAIFSDASQTFVGAAMAISPTEVVFGWAGLPMNPGDTYTISESADGTNFTPIATTLPQGNYDVVEGLEPNTTYYFQVEEKSSSGAEWIYTSEPVVTNVNDPDDYASYYQGDEPLGVSNDEFGFYQTRRPQLQFRRKCTDR